MNKRNIAIALGVTLAIGTSITLGGTLVFWRAAARLAVQATTTELHSTDTDRLVVRGLLLTDASPERRDRMLRWLADSDDAEIRAWAMVESSAVQATPRARPPAILHAPPAAEIASALEPAETEAFETSTSPFTAFEESEPESLLETALIAETEPVSEPESFANTESAAETEPVDFAALSPFAALPMEAKTVDVSIASSSASTEVEAVFAEPLTAQLIAEQPIEQEQPPEEVIPTVGLAPEVPVFSSLPSAITTAEVPIPIIATEELDVWNDKGHEQAQKVLNSRSKELDGCYAMALLSNPKVSGLIDVQWNVLNGRVGAISIPINTTGSDRVGTCIAGRVKRWRFPPTVKGDVTWTLYLRPGDPEKHRRGLTRSQ